MSKIKNSGLDQYGTEPFEQQQFKTAGVEGVNVTDNHVHRTTRRELTVERTIEMRQDMQLFEYIKR